MPDITMCRNATCAVKESCYRWTAEPNPRWQSYSWFRDIEGDKKCRHFLEDVRKNVANNVEHPPVVDTI